MSTLNCFCDWVSLKGSQFDYFGKTLEGAPNLKIERWNLHVFIRIKNNKTPGTEEDAQSSDSPNILSVLHLDHLLL